jgi:hypothetical protein
VDDLGGGSRFRFTRAGAVFRRARRGLARVAIGTLDSSFDSSVCGSGASSASCRLVFLISSATCSIAVAPQGVVQERTMRQLKGLLRCFVLSIGLSMIRPEEIEELMYLAQIPKVVQVVKTTDETS